jgi:hypothetical protein
MAVDTLGHLLALLVTPADEQDRVYMEALARDFESQLLARVFAPDEAR